jgi:hypothetical protein
MSDAQLLSRTGEKPYAAPAISRFEFLPGWVCYGPVVAQWIALGLWSLDFSLPTAANPRITTGGLCGERKSAILALAGAEATRWIAPTTTMVVQTDDVARAHTAMAQAGLSLPVVVKPDIGCNGTGVRLVRDEAALAASLAAFPRGTALVLQQFSPHPGEAGIFYIRHPDAPVGKVTSLTLKYPPMVVGNGRATLRELIEADPRHARLQGLYLERLAGRLEAVPPAGETVQLVFAGNHCKGSIFANGEAEITPALTARIEEIARDIPDFHFGRFDVRYASLAELRRGAGFTIIEINGVGAEATHIWDPSTSLWRIWRDQLFHYGSAWAIARRMRARGAKTSGLRTMYRDWMNQRRLMASYPLND